MTDTGDHDSVPDADMDARAAAAALEKRLDDLPASPLIWSWVARISFGAFFDIYEVALTGVLAPLLVRAGVFHHGAGGLFGLSDPATFGFATFGGLFAGVLFSSPLIDRWGRRPMFAWSMVIYAAATAVMALQTTAAGVCAWRFVVGVGVGAQVVAGDAYLAELLPKRVRGRGFAVAKSIQYSAAPLASLLGAVAAHAPGTGEAWRGLLLVPLAGVVALRWVRQGLPESPRWLALHGRIAEAERVVVRAEAAAGAPVWTASAPATASAAEAPRSLLRPPLRRRTLTLLVAGGASSVAFYGFNNWLPTLLEARGADVVRSLAYTAAIGLAYPLAPLAFFTFADRVERKHQIVVGACLMAAAGLGFAAQTTPAGWVTLGFTVSIGANLMASASHTYRSELFPTAVRGRAIGVIYAVDRLFAASVGYAVAAILGGAGVSGVLVFITAAALLDAAVIFSFGPRSRGLASEEVRDGPPRPAARRPPP